MSDAMTIEEMKQVWEEYKNTQNRSPEYKTLVLQKIKENPSNTWVYIFSADKEMQQKILLLEVDAQAQESKESYMSANQDLVLLEIIADLAHVTSRYSDDITPGVDPTKVEVWNTVFQDVPQFKTLFEKTINKSVERNKKILQQYSEALKDEENKTAVAKELEILTFVCPIIFKKNGEVNGELIYETQPLIDNLVTHYNQFRLDSYMKLSFACVDTQMKVNNNEAVFYFYLKEQIPVGKMQEYVEETRKSLKGQLSDGWGESLSQGQLLSGTNILSIDFDYEKLKEVTILSNNMKLK